MTTTTPAAIVAKIVSVIEALTPAAEPLGRTFRRTPGPRGSLRKWAVDAGGENVFRAFDIVRSGDREEIGVQDPVATLSRVAFTVTIAYAAQPQLAGLASYAALEDAIEADGRQVRNAVSALAALADGGHLSSIVTIRGPDRSDDQVWFQELAVEATFFVAQAYA